MNRYTDPSLSSPRPAVVALGCFDGVHLGHRAVLREAKATALRLGIDAAAFSFTQPPKNFFVPGAVSLLTLPEEKTALIEAVGIDSLWDIPFTAKISGISAKDFFTDLLLTRLKARHILCGYNYTFGKKAEGNVALLRELCAAHHVGLTVLPPITVDGMEVSSSAIRAAIAEGRPEDAARALGRPYSVKARVIDGQKLARQLGFPTVNQIIPSPLTVPRYGVYACRVRIDGNGASYWGISNVGVRPTVKGSLLCVESHLFDFDGDLYGKELSVEFLSFLREERRFDSLEALTAQVRSDIQTAKEIIAFKYKDC